ncbi:MAG: hypothetical protein H5U02_00175 [Clostridia bacterium]|nr:hypothetical protein [Clostridia bacterium]
MMQERVNQLIDKWQIILLTDGRLMVQGKPGPKTMAELKALKEEIKAELLRRAEEQKARREAAEAERKAREEAERKDILEGRRPITVYWYDGEVLSAYMAGGIAAGLLEELGLAKYIEGWGWKVNKEVVEALGTEFTYQQAYEFARPAIEAKAEAKAKAEAVQQAKFQEAKATGRPVVLAHWMEPCNDPREECDLDSVTQLAMPDGSIQIQRTHTW